MTAYEKFCNTLKSLFMLDVAADLDFGIYRIMNFKRKDIEDYLDNRLKRVVDEEVNSNISSSHDEKEKELNDLIANLIKYHAPVDSNSEVIRLRAELAGMGNPADMQSEVFTHLDTFFSRYYESGDFISKRRYKKDVYAIPYEGEEVKLYWANADQYYIKTGENFRNYRFRIDSAHTAEFTLKEAAEEQNNKKEKKELAHRFAIYKEHPTEVEGDTLRIFFTYQLMPKSVKQDKLIKEAVEVIAPLIPAEFLGGLMMEVNSEKHISLLDKHLKDFTQRNASDYFIHKELRGFLMRELDFYVKNEILFIDDIDTADTNKFLAHLAVIKAVKRVGAELIAFLAQLEDFQKRLLLKKKFVVQADWCMTLDHVPTALFEEVCKNDRQREEWIKLFKIDEIIDSGLGMTASYSEPLTVQFLEENQHLVLDTAFFDAEFKHKLLSSMENVDKQSNGLLINSENFQALRLLLNKYKGSVKSVYIDPPYNTKGDGFVYKDNYQESSWLSCIYDRLQQSKPLYADGGSVSVSIDIKELDKMVALMDMSIGDEYRKANITVRRASITGAKVINPGLVNIAENVVMYANGVGKWIPQDAYRERDFDDRYGSIIININDDKSKWEFSSVLEEFAKYKGIPKTAVKKTLGDKFAEEILEFAIKNADAIFQSASLDLDSVGKDAVELYHKSKKEPDRIFHAERGEDYNDYFIKNGKILLFYKDRLKNIGGRLVPVEKVSDIWDDVLPNDIHNEGGVVLKKGKKPEKLVDRVFEATSNEGDLVLDYFAGSGTSAAVALKSGRKFIAVEVNEYFDTITLRRMKNTLYGDKSGVTDKYQWKGGGIVKYLRLEQYEDALNNLAVADDGKMKFGDNYAVNYMLNVETQDSLFNPEWFLHPFSVKMYITSQNEKRETSIDIPETFNYLIGLSVERVSWPEEGLHIVSGTTRDGEATLVVWRDIDTITNEMLTETINKHCTDIKHYRRIYINGDNTFAASLPQSMAERVRLTDAEFEKLMFDTE